MKPFAACVFVAVLSGALAGPSDGLRDPEAALRGASKWEAFKAKHGKQHAAHEEPARMARFMERDAEIEAHNARYAAGKESYSRRHNQYSDLSHEEFRRAALGFVPAVNASEIPHAELPMMPSIPASFDWAQQGIMTPVRNQEYCGSCYAFAGAGALEGYLKWKTGATYDLSEQDVVDCSYKRFMGGAHNGGCQGGWPTAVYEYYNVKDLVAEQQYPYTSGRSQRHGSCKIPSPINDVVKGRLRIRNVRPRTEDEMAQILVSKGPLVIAMAGDGEFQKFFNDLGDGVFDNDNAINVQPNHAVVLVGYGVQNGKPFWNIKNSWGNTWANRGYGKIRRGRNMCNLMQFGVWYVE